MSSPKCSWTSSELSIPVTFKGMSGGWAPARVFFFHLSSAVTSPLQFPLGSLSICCPSSALYYHTCKHRGQLGGWSQPHLFLQPCLQGPTLPCFPVCQHYFQSSHAFPLIQLLSRSNSQLLFCFSKTFFNCCLLPENRPASCVPVPLLLHGCSRLDTPRLSVSNSLSFTPHFWAEIFLITCFLFLKEFLKY